MNEDKSLFERLDDISNGQSAILDAVSGVQGKFSNTDDKIAKLEKEINDLKKQNVGSGQQTTVANNQIDEINPLKQFLIKAKKSWRWLGSKSEFGKMKKLVILSLIALLAIGVLEIVVSSICFQMFSTFTLFEGIWIIFSIIYLSNVSSIQLTEDINSFQKHSSYRFSSDPSGMLYPEKEKLVFCIFRWLALISVIANIICIWAGMGKEIKVLATIVEVLYFAIIVVSIYGVSYLYAGYSIIWLDGNNVYTGEKAVLVLPPGAKQFMTEEEFRKKIPYIFE